MPRSPLAAVDARKAMTAWHSSASPTLQHRLRKVAVLGAFISDTVFREKYHLGASEFEIPWRSLKNPRLCLKFLILRRLFAMPF